MLVKKNVLIGYKGRISHNKGRVSVNKRKSKKTTKGNGQKGRVNINFKNGYDEVFHNFKSIHENRLD